jgi:hypothetical protein
MAKNLVRIADSNFDRMQARAGLTLKNQSQMSKLPNVSEPEPMKSNVEYVARLREFRDRCKEATRRLHSMQGLATPRQIKRLTLAMGFFDDERKAKVPYGTGKAVRAVLNELTSLREAAYLDELTDELIDLSATNALFETVDTLIEKAIEKSKEEEQPSDSVFDPNLVSILEHASAQTTLPRLTEEKPFVLARVPVIPVANMSHAKLQGRDFKVTNVGGYLMMNDQIVLGISPKQGFDAANRIRIEIRKQTKQKLVFVDERPTGHKGALWYWLMHESDLQQFMAAFPNNTLKVQSWGLAV